MTDLEVTIKMGLNRHTRKIIGLLENAHWCKTPDLLFLLNESEKRRVQAPKRDYKAEREDIQKDAGY